ncbi:MAG: hypothetical protein Q7R78_01600 [bacterium]|nr:hypothetical protein [bacterium]
MFENLYTKELQKIKAEYFSIGKIKCPVLNDNHVHFNQYGFRHFIRKGKNIRPVRDQMRRFDLFKYVKDIVCSLETNIMEVRVHKKAEYFALINKNNHHIKVIVGQINFGKLFFVSVMDFKKQK